MYYDDDFYPVNHVKFFGRLYLKTGYRKRRMVERKILLDEIESKMGTELFHQLRMQFKTGYNERAHLAIRGDIYNDGAINSMDLLHEALGQLTEYTEDGTYVACKYNVDDHYRLILQDGRWSYEVGFLVYDDLKRKSSGYGITRNGHTFFLDEDELRAAAHFYVQKLSTPLVGGVTHDES